MTALQLTVVREGRPLRKLPRLVGGIAAPAAAWVVAIVLHHVTVDFQAPPESGLTSRSGPVAGPEIGAVPVLVGAWQVWGFVMWRGRPFADLRRRGVGVVSGNIVVVGGALLTYAVAHGGGGVRPPVVNAAGGNVIAAGLIVGMPFEGVFRSLGPALERLATPVGTLLLAAALYAALTAYANGRQWTEPSSQDRVGHAALDAIGVSVILHVAIGRRRPFGDDTVAEGDAGGGRDQRRARRA